MCMWNRLVKEAGHGTAIRLYLLGIGIVVPPDFRAEGVIVVA